jgi:rhodanese-related sulfurtransferase
MENTVNNEGGTIVDVRTRGEFQGGSVAGAINIPLQEISQKVEELRRLKGPLVLCCASGNRSGQAHRYLKQQGIECVDGGSWLNVTNYKSQTA